MATHGKKTRIIIGGYDMNGIGYSARQQFTKELAPADTFYDGESISEAGLKGGVFTIESRHKGSAAATQYLLDEMTDAVETYPHVIYGPLGLEVGDPVYLSETHHNSCEVGGDNKSVVTVNCSFTANGGVTEAILLVSPYA